MRNNREHTGAGRGAQTGDAGRKARRLSSSWGITVRSDNASTRRHGQGPTRGPRSPPAERQWGRSQGLEE